MARRGSNRHRRIALRVTRAEKQLLSTAAAYERLDVASFIKRTILPVARKVIGKAEPLSLSERDSVRVSHLLANPPAPPAAARRLNDQTVADAASGPSPR